jgi:autotransporter strand-loop-strand O-heptosyltransferase
MLKYKIDFINGLKIDIDNDNLDIDYHIFFYSNNNLIYSSIIKKGSWSQINDTFFRDWNIKVYGNDELLLDYNLNLDKKIILIRFDSKAIGDTLAWIPYVEEFRKKHNCIVFCSTFLNFLFKEIYKNIHFIEPHENIDYKFGEFHIGWYNPQENRNPKDYKKLPLQQTASDILGLEYKEIRPIVNQKITGDKPIEKYVCIAEYSTANCKHWHYPIVDSNKGWQKIVDWLNYNGYKVMVISKQKTRLKNIIDRTGNYPLDIRIFELSKCDFFIGIGSGLSWLAWSLNKKVIMISGFSDPICEFKENNIRIINTNVCHNCFTKYEFDKGDWNWCPLHKNTNKQFECSTNITPKMVSDKIIENSLIIDKKEFFDFSIKNKETKIYKNDIEISYDKNRINFYNKRNKSFEDINIIIKNDKNEIVKRISDLTINSNQTYWTSFECDTKYYIIDILNYKNILLQKKINI